MSWSKSGFFAARECLDSIDRIDAFALQCPLDEIRADKWRHPETRLHFELVDHHGIVTLGAQLPSLSAELEVAFLRFRYGDDVDFRRQEKITPADKCMAVNQNAALHACVKTWQSVFSRFNVLTCDDRARKFLELLIVDQHCVKIVLSGLYEGLRDEMIAPILHPYFNGSEFATTSVAE